MKKILLLLVFVLLSCNNKGEIDYTKRINAVKTAFEYKTIDSLSPFLANQYTVKGIPEGMEPIVVPMLFQKMPAPKKFTIESQTKEEKGMRLKVIFYDAENNPSNADFLVAKDGKFLELNVLSDAKISTSVEK